MARKKTVEESLDFMDWNDKKQVLWLVEYLVDKEWINAVMPSIDPEHSTSGIDLIKQIEAMEDGEKKAAQIRNLWKAKKPNKIKSPVVTITKPTKKNLDYLCQRWDMSSQLTLEKAVALVSEVQHGEEIRFIQTNARRKVLIETSAKKEAEHEELKQEIEKMKAERGALEIEIQEKRSSLLSAAIEAQTEDDKDKQAIESLIDYAKTKNEPLNILIPGLLREESINQGKSSSEEPEPNQRMQELEIDLQNSFKRLEELILQRTSISQQSTVEAETEADRILTEAKKKRNEIRSALAKTLWKHKKKLRIIAALEKEGRPVELRKKRLVLRRVPVRSRPD